MLPAVVHRGRFLDCAIWALGTLAKPQIKQGSIMARLVFALLISGFVASACSTASSHFSAAFDMVNTYDKVHGPLFLSGKTFKQEGESKKLTPPATDVHWAVFTVMQQIRFHDDTAAFRGFTAQWWYRALKHDRDQRQSIYEHVEQLTACKETPADTILKVIQGIIADDLPNPRPESE